MHERNWVQKFFCREERLACRVVGLAFGVCSAAYDYHTCFFISFVVVVTTISIIFQKSLKVFPADIRAQAAWLPASRFRFMVLGRFRFQGVGHGVLDART